MRFHDVLPDLLGSQAKTKILQEMLSYPSRQWTGRELARQAGISPPQAQTALRTFESYGMAFSRPVGKSRVWALNTAHAFISSFRAMLDVRLDFQSHFTDALRRRLGQKAFSEILEIALFGSVARSQDTHGSDIDVLVVVSRPAYVEKVRDACLSVSVDLLDRFDKTTMPLVWSRRELSSKNPELLKNIRQDGVVIYGDDLHAAVR
ncbi:nucleotidyltransferase domain-containing protein [Candidatus Micrarchaeota archaeon]|nr:nucleotidyltransferase domain-containing protein [Candidatus Micrarchaeota archaeon]